MTPPPNRPQDRNNREKDDDVADLILDGIKQLHGAIKEVDSDYNRQLKEIALRLAETESCIEPLIDMLGRGGDPKKDIRQRVLLAEERIRVQDNRIDELKKERERDQNWFKGVIGSILILFISMIVNFTKDSMSQSQGGGNRNRDRAAVSTTQDAPQSDVPAMTAFPQPLGPSQAYTFSRTSPTQQQFLDRHSVYLPSNSQ